MGNQQMRDEDDSPHYSEVEFQNQVELPPSTRNLIICWTSFMCMPCIYFCCIKPNLPYYRGLPPNCIPLQGSQEQDYVRRMEGSYSIGFLDTRAYKGSAIPTYEKLEVYGNKMIFSGGMHATHHHNHHHGHTSRGAAPNAPSEQFLHFFEGKEAGQIFCDYYGSKLLLNETDFVNQITMDHCLGYRVRFTRVGQQAQQHAPFPQQQAPFPQQQAPFPQQQAPFPQQQAPFPQQQAPFPQQQAPPQQMVYHQPMAPLAPPAMGVPHQYDTGQTSHATVLCPKCATPRPFAESAFCGKCGTSFS